MTDSSDKIKVDPPMPLKKLQLQKVSLHSYTTKKTILVFSSCGKEVKAFHRTLEAIDYIFARTNYQRQKIIF